MGCSEKDIFLTFDKHTFGDQACQSYLLSATTVVCVLHAAGVPCMLCDPSRLRTHRAQIGCHALPARLDGEGAMDGAGGD